MRANRFDRFPGISAEVHVRMSEEGGLLVVASKKPATWRKGRSKTPSAPMRHPIPGLPFLLLFKNTSVESIVNPEIPLLPQPIHLLCK